MRLLPAVWPLLGAAVALACALGTVAGLRRHRPCRPRPWWLLAGALAGLAAGRLLQGLAAAGTPPGGAGPAGPAVMLAATTAGVIALVRLTLVRLGREGRDATADAAAVAVAVSLGFWYHLLHFRPGGAVLGLAALTLAVHVTVLTVLLRLLFVAGRRPAARWLAAAGLLATAGSVLNAVAAGTQPTPATELLWGAALPCVALAALHPSMRQLSEAAAATAALDERVRLRLLAAALPVGPAALLWRSTPDRRAGTLAALAALTVSAAMLWRLQRLLTDRKGAEAELRRQASQDALTALPNRRRLLAALDDALSGMPVDGVVAVFLIDLDDFKLLNDGLGHAAGDRFLVAVAGRLRAAARTAGTVGRLGGDEFALVCPDLPDAAAAERVSQRLAEHLNGDYDLDGQRVHATASVGVALAERPGITTADLLASADAAMYHAKRQGRGRVERYRPAHSARSARRLQLASDLWKAVERGQLTICYQPELDVASGRTLWAEALLRWHHPRFGELSPDEYLDLAESTGAIVPIGAEVLRRVCLQAAWWAQRHPQACPRTVAVNVSARQLSDAGFVASVADALAASGLDPSMLWLELTETSVMADPDGVATILQQLKSLGVGVAVDDFGTGYSSLAHLKRFPLDALKVDRSFVGGVTGDLHDRSIVAAVIELAHALGLRVIAEGVETVDQLAELHRLGCDVAQGYLWSEPMEADRFAAWMTRPRVHPLDPRRPALRRHG